MPGKVCLAVVGIGQVASAADSPDMPVNEPRRWHCATCGRRVFRIEVAAATIVTATSRHVRFHAQGACREHQPGIRRQMAANWPTAVARRSAHLRSNTVATWVVATRNELLSHTNDDGYVDEACGGEQLVHDGQ